MDTLIGETLSMAVLDSGFTKTVCSKTWLNCYLESLSSEELVRPYLNLAMGRFAFHWMDHNTSSHSWTECVTTEVIKNDIPLLLTKDTMEKANTYIDFANDKMIILNKEVPVKFTTSGH